MLQLKSCLLIKIYSGETNPASTRQWMEPAFSTGQSVRPGAGRGRTTLCRLVWSFFQTCPATHRQGLVPRCPREKCLILAALPPCLPQQSPVVPCTLVPCTSSPLQPLQPPAVPGSYPQSQAVTRSHPQPPSSLMLKVAGDHSLFPIIFVFFSFTHWYYLLPYYFLPF